MTNFVNELSFEFAVHILFYEDQNEIIIIHSDQYLFPIVFFLSLMLEKLIHKKWQSSNQIVNKYLGNSLKYFIIHGKSYLTYILNHLWGPIIVAFGGGI